MLLPDWKRAVVKVGSALVAPDGVPSDAHLSGVARFVEACRADGREVILVSSGAVASGRAGADGQRPRPRSLAEKQALAALGQPRLMAVWSALLGAPCAQLLLTYDDLRDRSRVANARATLGALLRMEAIPIVNENDTVAVEELKVGDNDNLAAHVAALADADLLVILSDVAGLFDADPRAHPDAKRIDDVPRIDESVYARAGGAGTANATGGMRTKIEAADKATARGIATVLVSGTRPEVLDALARGQVDGTYFHPHGHALAARKHWLRHTALALGTVRVDAGAVRALLEKGASLLPSGIVAVEGHFGRGDAVRVVGPDGNALGKGIAQYGVADLTRLCGAQSHEIEARIGYCYAPEAIHRDDLVFLMDHSPVDDET